MAICCKVCVCPRIDEIKHVLLDKIKELKLYFFVKNEQYNANNRLKNEMSDNVMLVKVHYPKVMKINNKMSTSLLISVTQHLASSQQFSTFDVTANYYKRAL